MEMTTIKINKETLSKIKDHIALSGQTITSFIDIAVSNELDKVKLERKVLSSYAANMGPMLMKVDNKKKK